MTDKPENIGMDSKSTAERDRIDLNHEMAGLDNGRQYRFLSGSSQDFSYESKKEKAKRKFQTLLDMLLAEDPHYAALYHTVTEKLTKAQQSVDLALIDINQRLGAFDRKLQLLRENAAALADGTKVFQSNDGSIYTEHGKRLSAKESQNIHFPDNAASWEDYREAQEAYNLAIRQKADVETYQIEVLNPATQRMKDKDDPPSMDELEEMRNRIESKMPKVVETVLHNSKLNANPVKPLTSLAHDLEKTQLNVPDLGKSFDLARVDIPDFSTKPENGIIPAGTQGS